MSGTKAFITWGEHDLADNIVHLVLARTPDAPVGTRGLSLFVVPKRIVTEEGSLGSANSVGCVRVEEKLGIHASPTCVLEYREAEGELVGELNGGLHAMFTMMNIARLSIGLEGPAIAERAYQQALAYAEQRLQGRTDSTPPGRRSPIIEHPDVQRMLLSMRTLVQASRLIVYFTVGQGDVARNCRDEPTASRAQSLFDLLTPIAKAWSSDIGSTASSLGMQVLGGTGYLEETGMAQRLRDARIASIYEGTNGIQAIDLVTRKLGLEDGKAMHELLGDISATTTHRELAELAPSLEALSEAAGVLTKATEWMLARHAPAPDDVLAGASGYLELAGITIGGWLMTKRALELPDPALVGESNFYATEFVSRSAGLAVAITAGADRLRALSWRDAR